jgi:hypothetical protein
VIANVAAWASLPAGHSHARIGRGGSKAADSLGFAVSVNCWDRRNAQLPRRSPSVASRKRTGCRRKRTMCGGRLASPGEADLDMRAVPRPVRVLLQGRVGVDDT